MTSSDLLTILPLTVLAGWACLLLLLDLFISKARKGVTAFLAALGVLVTLALTLLQSGSELPGFGGMVVLDKFSTFVQALLLLSGLLGLALAYGYVKRMGLERGEYYTLLLFSLAGMLIRNKVTGRPSKVQVEDGGKG